MKSVIKFVLTVLVSVSVTSYLNALHSNLFDFYFNQCKRKLIAENNYQSLEQAFKCTEDSSTTLRILGTILFSEGSYLEGK
jgi:hypothetical protein